MRPFCLVPVSFWTAVPRFVKLLTVEGWQVGKHENNHNY